MSYKIQIESKWDNEVVADADVDTLEIAQEAIRFMKGCEGYNYTILDNSTGLGVQAGILSWEASDKVVWQRLEKAVKEASC